MAEENVSGIALDLRLETAGFSSGIARAKSELKSLQDAARNITIGVAVAPGRGGGGGGVQPPGVAVAMPGIGAQPRVSPRFQVSAGAVRDLRVDINAQMRALSARGEAVGVPIKLARIPYAQLRSEIARGIGEVPIKVTIDPASIVRAARQLASPTVAAQAGRAGLPSRAAGGSVSPPGSYIVHPNEIFRPTVAGRIEQLPHAARGRSVAARLTPEQLDFAGNLRATAARLQPRHIEGGERWYREAGAYGRAQAAKYKVADEKALGVLAALSAGTSWTSNRTKFERVLAAHAGGQPFPYSTNLDAHRKAAAILGGQPPSSAFRSSPKVGQFYAGLSGDLDAIVLDRWATRSTTRGALDSPPRSLRSAMESSWRTAAAEHGTQNAPYQAALWLLEKEQAGQAPGQMPLPFGLGGKVDAFGHPYRGSFSRHYGTRTHQQAIMPTFGRRGRGRRPWMMRPGDDELEAYYAQLDEEEGGPRPIWQGLTRWRGGRAEAYRRTIEQGGGTFGPGGQQPSRGYAVGLNAGEEIIGAGDRLSFIRGFRRIQKMGAPFTGTWLSEGNIHLNPVEVEARKRAAMVLSRREAQQAFYNLGAGEEIETIRRRGDPAPNQMKLPGFARGGAIDAIQSMFPNAKIRLDRFSEKALREIADTAGPLVERYPLTAKNMRAVAFDPMTERVDREGQTTIARLRSSPFDVVRGSPASYGSRMLFQNRAARWGPDIRKMLERTLVDPSLAGVFRHEFGHAVDYTHGTGPRYQTDLYDLRSLSPYANKGFKSEAFAELFSGVEGGVTGAERFRKQGFGAFLDKLSAKERSSTVRARAKGGPAGTYITAELGRELFVPSELEHLIPRNVAEKIPGGRAIGSARPGPGRMQEIGGRGPMVWQAPSDGWIIPNNLMNKIPRAQGGAAPGGYEGMYGGFEAGFEAEEAVRRAERERARRARASAETRRLSALSRGAQAQVSAVGGGLGDLSTFEEQNNALAEARLRLQTTERGLSARQGLGGLFRGFFGGERRREALQRGEFYEKQFQALEQERPLVGLIASFGALTKTSETLKNEISGLDTTTKKGQQRFKSLSKDLADVSRAIDITASDIVKQEGLKAEATKAFSEATSGALTNIASLTAAGFVYSAASQAVSAAIDLSVKSISPIIDRLSGFTAVNARVSKGLAEQLPQAGTLGTLFGQVGIQAGLSGGNASFLQQQLGGGIFAKAGAQKAASADELFRAALGTGAPQGLLGGYGGLFGSALFGEQLGGGRGLLETIAGTAKATTTPTLVGSSDPIGDMVAQWLREQNKSGKGIGSLLGPEPAQTQEQADVQRETIDYVNEAIARGRTAQGLITPGPQLVNVGEEDARAKRIAADEALDQTIRDLAGAGEVFLDARGNLITDSKKIIEATSQLAQGLTIPAKDVFLKANRQQLIAQQQLAQEQGQFERGIAIPGAIGQQILTNPFAPAETGLANAGKGFQSTITDLGEINRLQKELTAEAHAAVEEQAKFIDRNVTEIQPSGMTAGNQFRANMRQVEAYGQQIANINAALADRQAQVNAMQYGLSLRILSRSIRDARGLAGMGGGSRLGIIERRQYELGRESGALGLQSQGLSLAMNQRQINFQTALAGFQAVGISGEERAARMEEAKAEAKFAQQQQDIATALLAIAQKQFGLEGQAFGIQTTRQVADLEAQREILQASHALEQEQLAAQKHIVALGMKQARLQQDAQSLFGQATNNFNNKLQLAASFTAMYAGTVAMATRYIEKALGITINRGNERSSTATGGHAEGIVGVALSPTQALFGEANKEGIAIVKNPRIGSMAPVGGGSVTINVPITITGNSIRDDSDITKLVRRLKDEVIEEIGRKAGMLSLAS